MEVATATTECACGEERYSSFKAKLYGFPRAGLFVTLSLSLAKEFVFVGSIVKRHSCQFVDLLTPT